MSTSENESMVKNGVSCTGILTGIGIFGRIGKRNRADLKSRRYRTPGTHVVKQVLLGVAGVTAKISFGETLQARRTCAAAGKIKLLKGFHDPDIHRERVLKAVGEQQNAVGNLPAHAGEIDQFSASLGHRQVLQPRQIQL